MSDATGLEPKRGRVAHRQRHVFTMEAGFARAASTRLPWLGRVARILSRGDAHLAQDMVQEALVELWERDFSRFDAADERELRRVLIHRMRFTGLRERLDWGTEWRAKGDPEEMENDARDEEEMGPSEAMRGALDDDRDVLLT